MADQKAKVTIETRKKGKGIEETKRNLAGLNQGVAPVKSGFSQLTGVIAKCAIAIGGLYVAKKAADWLMGSVDAASKQELIFKKLEIACNNVGIGYAQNELKIRGFLAAMQETTQYGDTETAVVLQSMAEYTGNLNDAMEGTRIALDMASAGLFDYNTAAKYVGMAMNGQVEMLGRYIPELRTSSGLIDRNSTAAEKWAVAQRLLQERFGGQAQAQLNTYAGQVKQLRNYYGDLREMIGNKFIPTMAKMVGGLVGWLKNLTDVRSEAEKTLGVLSQYGSLAERLSPLQQRLALLETYKDEDDMLKKIQGTYKEQAAFLTEYGQNITGMTTQKYMELDITNRIGILDRERNRIERDLVVAATQEIEIREKLQKHAEGIKVLTDEQYLKTRAGLGLNQERQINLKKQLDILGGVAGAERELLATYEQRKDLQALIVERDKKIGEAITDRVAKIKEEAELAGGLTEEDNARIKALKTLEEEFAEQLNQQVDSLDINNRINEILQEQDKTLKEQQKSLEEIKKKEEERLKALATWKDQYRQAILPTYEYELLKLDESYQQFVDTYGKKDEVANYYLGIRAAKIAELAEDEKALQAGITGQFALMMGARFGIFAETEEKKTEKAKEEEDKRTRAYTQGQEMWIAVIRAAGAELAYLGDKEVALHKRVTNQLIQMYANYITEKLIMEGAFQGIKLNWIQAALAVAGIAYVQARAAQWASPSYESPEPTSAGGTPIPTTSPTVAGGGISYSSGTRAAVNYIQPTFIQHYHFTNFGEGALRDEFIQFLKNEGLVLIESEFDEWWANRKRALALP